MDSINMPLQLFQVVRLFVHGVGRYPGPGFGSTASETHRLGRSEEAPVPIRPKSAPNTPGCPTQEDEQKGKDCYGRPEHGIGTSASAFENKYGPEHDERRPCVSRKQGDKDDDPSDTLRKGLEEPAFIPRSFELGVLIDETARGVM
jgi:hypothetical protein